MVTPPGRVSVPVKPKCTCQLLKVTLICKVLRACVYVVLPRSRRRSSAFRASSAPTMPGSAHVSVTEQGFARHQQGPCPRRAPPSVIVCGAAGPTAPVCQRRIGQPAFRPRRRGVGGRSQLMSEAEVRVTLSSWRGGTCGRCQLHVSFPGQPHPPLAASLGSLVVRRFWTT